MESARARIETQRFDLHLNQPQGSPRQGNNAKTLGAYYTDAQIADFLARWAICSPEDAVMDPSFGGGVFLRAACNRLLQLGGIPKSRISGVEIDGKVHRDVSDALVGEYSLNRKNLVCADFFALDLSSTRPVDAIIGNPPFIRYQRFNGASRKSALARSLAAGVRLPELCSSWAPFVIHSIAMLNEGGRLAMVLPVELAHAKYARPVLEQVRQSFKAVTFLTFRKKLFPDLSEGTLLLLAEGKGCGPAKFSIRDYPHASSLSELDESTGLPRGRVQPLPAESIALGKSRLIEYLIPRKARQLYQHLRDGANVQKLASFASVGIGYVTGANDFFHISPEVVQSRRIAHEFLKPAVRRGRAFGGLRFTEADWKHATSNGDGGYLLHIPKQRPLPESIREYIRWGESQGINEAYKCRVRSPWFCVPHVHKADAFLTYMSGATPRLVANSAGAVAPNTLHVVRFDPLFSLSCNAVTVLWQTSLTRLSVELQGHALGGGMLKLEPTEAGKVLIALPNEIGSNSLRDLELELDELQRLGNGSEVPQLVDRAILQNLLGLSKSDCKLLESSADVLRGRRYGELNRGIT